MSILGGLFGSKGKGVAPPIPKNSITMLAPQAAFSLLGVDAYKNVTAYLEQKHNCKNFTIDKVEPIAYDDDLQIDGTGRLHKGACSEQWHITVCGKPKVVKMAFCPDGKGGSLIAIGEAAATEPPPPVWQVAFPELESWGVGFTQRQGREYNIEYTHRGEKVESWSQLVTFMYLNLPKENFRDAMNQSLLLLKRDCASLKVVLIAKGDFKFVYRWSHDGCGGFPAQEVVSRAEYVEGGLLTLQYAYLKGGKVTPDFSAWIKRVTDAQITR